MPIIVFVGCPTDVFKTLTHHGHEIYQLESLQEGYLIDLKETIKMFSDQGKLTGVITSSNYRALYEYCWENYIPATTLDPLLPTWEYAIDRLLSLLPQPENTPEMYSSSPIPKFNENYIVSHAELSQPRED